MNPHRPLVGDLASSVAVATIYVEATRVWIRCPHCQESLEGFCSDPRGHQDVICHDCGGRFDIPRHAQIVIT